MPLSRSDDKVADYPNIVIVLRTWFQTIQNSNRLRYLHVGTEYSGSQ